MNLSDSTLKNKLVKKIRKEFPELSFSKSSLIKNGNDHIVVLLDKKLIIRFPIALYRKTFLGELKLLKALKTKSPIRIPEYIYLASNHNFGGYRIIEGNELTVSRFRRLSISHKRRFVQAMGSFLSVVHSLPKSLLPRRRGTEPWDGARLKLYHTRYLKERRSVIATYIDQKTLNLIDNFFPQFLKIRKEPIKRKITHGDLTDHHILLGSSGRVAGIIDFGDAVFGDPAYDFCFFFSYGDDIAKEVYKSYKYHLDKNLLKRSEMHYLRFLIDRLYYNLIDKDTVEARRNLVALKKKLKKFS